jgi:hypothetical protein
LIKKAAHISLSVWLATLLLFGNISKEFIHSFTHHTDTVEHSYDGLAFEKEHHHCDFLNFSLTAFANDIQFPFVAVSSVKYLLQNFILINGVYQHTPSVSFLRGPPSVA